MAVCDVHVHNLNEIARQKVSVHPGVGWLGDAGSGEGPNPLTQVSKKTLLLMIIIKKQTQKQNKIQKNFYFLLCVESG